MASAIITNLTSREPTAAFTLQESESQELFAAEWALARLEFVRWIGQTIHDPVLRAQWVQEIDGPISEFKSMLAPLHEEIASWFSWRDQYQFYASPGEKKLGTGPGFNLSIAYGCALKAMTAKGERQATTEPSAAETLSIALTAETNLMHFNDSLETVLRNTCDRVDPDKREQG